MGKGKEKMVAQRVATGKGNEMVAQRPVATGRDKEKVVAQRPAAAGKGKEKAKAAPAPAAKGRKRKAAEAPTAGSDGEGEEEDFEGEVEDGEESGEEGEKGEESDSEEEDLDMKEAEGQPTDLQVEFIFTDPTEDDAPYLRALLHNGALMQASSGDAPGLAALLAEQAAVGTLIKADGELFGFTTALSLQRHAKKRCLAPILALLNERVLRPEVAAVVKALLAPEGPPVGLVLSERMINTPISLVPHALESLSLDIDWAKQHDEDPAERNSFHFHRLLLLAQVEKSGEAAAPSGKGKKAKAGAGKAAVLAGVSFLRVEEEVLAEEAEEVSLVRGGLPGGAQLLLMILKPEALANAVPALKAVMCD